MTSFDETTKIWKGPNTCPSYPTNIHISEIILESLKKTPKRLLQIYDETGAHLTCEDLRLKATRVAQNLTKLGIKQGDVVGINCSNSENICAVLHGCIFIGAILSPMSPVHDKNDLIHIWSQTEPKFIFCDAEVYVKVIDALTDMNNNATVCTLIERKLEVLFIGDVLESTGIEDSLEPIKCENSEKIPISFSISSGTTGAAKVVCVSQFYYLQMADMLQFAENRILCSAAISGVVGLGLFIALPLTKLARVVTRGYGEDGYVKVIEKFQVEYLFTTPAILNNILKLPALATNLSSLKVIVGGSIFHPDLRLRFKRTFPETKLIPFYGMTEVMFTSPLLSGDNEGYTVGRIYANCEVKITDDDGNSLGVDKRGEIFAKPQYPFLGYYRQPEASKAAVEKGFYKTGDIGFFDQSGVLNVVERKKDVFKYHLFQINPVEIENVILSIEGIYQASVVAIFNEETHSKACAVVIKCEGYEHITEKSIIAYVADRMPVYKQLHGGVIFVSKFPLSSSGKILKRLIADFAEKELTKLNANCRHDKV